MASGDTLATADALSGRPPEVDFARIDFRSGVAVLDFGDTGDPSTAFSLLVPTGYAGGGFRLRLAWAAESAVAGQVVWSARADRIAFEGGSIDSPSFGVEKTSTGAPSVTTGGLTVTEIALSHTDADGPVPGDMILVRVRRAADSVDDTMPGDAELVALEVREN